MASRPDVQCRCRGHQIFADGRHEEPIFTFDSGLAHIRHFGDWVIWGACALGSGLSFVLGWTYGAWSLALWGIAGLMGLATLILVSCKGTWFSSVALPAVLMCVVALNIQLGGGRSEYHFGVFTSLAVLLVYRHWLPIAVGAGVIAVHHFLFDRLQAAGFPVFCQSVPDLIGVLHHASYVVAEAGFGIILARSMRQDALLSEELNVITRGLVRQQGKVDFSGLDRPLQSAAGKQLQAILQTVRASVGVVLSAMESVNDSSAEIAGGNQDLSTRTEKAAVELQRTASAIEQLNSAVGSATESTKKAAELAKVTAEHAASGEKAAEQLAVSMQKVSDSSRKVFDITGVIDSLAFQTNILALNAAVEAARAGEHGRGFSVVASEVRQLAQRSAKAAGEIKTLLAQSGEEVSEGAGAGASTRETLLLIMGEVRRVSGMLDEIACTAQEQSRGIAEVNRAVVELDQATQQNAALVEQSAAAAASLKSQATGLAEAMRTFELGKA